MPAAVGSNDLDEKFNSLDDPLPCCKNFNLSTAIRL